MSALPFTTLDGKYRAQCRICGKEIARFPVLDIPIIGQPGEKAKKVMKILGAHIATKHTEQFAAGMAMIQDFQAFLILSQFEVSDPTIRQRFEAIRAGMQMLTRKFTMSDQHISDAVTALDSANQLTPENVKLFVREVRDILTEQEKHGPQIEQAQSNLVI